MYMIFYWIKERTRQGNFLIYWGPSKTNKSDYFIKYNPSIHHTVMRHEYLHKANHGLSFVPPRGSINHILGLNSTNMSHEHAGPTYIRQEPGGSMSNCLTLVTKQTCPKSNRQEPVGSTSDRITLVLRKIHHICTQNKIAIS